MVDRFRPLSPRIGAHVTIRREEILNPESAQECRAALERYGVLVFPQLSLTDEEQVAFSSLLGTVIPQGKVRSDGTPM